MNSLTALEAQQTFLELLKQVTEQQSTFKIKSEGGSAILLSEADYEELMETLELLSIHGFRDRLQCSVQQISTGKTYSLDEVFGDKSSGLPTYLTIFLIASRIRSTVSSASG